MCYLVNQTCNIIMYRETHRFKIKQRLVGVDRCDGEGSSGVNTIDIGNKL